VLLISCVTSVLEASALISYSDFFCQCSMHRSRFLRLMVPASPDSSSPVRAGLCAYLLVKGWGVERTVIQGKKISFLIRQAR